MAFKTGLEGGRIESLSPPAHWCFLPSRSSTCERTILNTGCWWFCGMAIAVQSGRIIESRNLYPKRVRVNDRAMLEDKAVSLRAHRKLLWREELVYKRGTWDR